MDYILVLLLNTKRRADLRHSDKQMSGGLWTFGGAKWRLNFRSQRQLKHLPVQINNSHHDCIQQCSRSTPSHTHTLSLW